MEYASFEEVAAAFDESALDLDYSKRDLDASYDASSATVITLSFDSTSVQGAGAQASAAGVDISSAGTYIVSGELTDGQLLVDAGDDDKVQLVLAGAIIHNEDGAAIYVRNADKCFVTLAWMRGRRTICPTGRRMRWKMIPTNRTPRCSASAT